MMLVKYVTSFFSKNNFAYFSFKNEFFNVNYTPLVKHIKTNEISLNLHK